MLRSEIQPFIGYRIGCGEGTNFWHPVGPLHQYFSENFLYYFGLAKDAKVASIIQNNKWKWPRGRSRTMGGKQLIQKTSPLFVPNSGDKDEVYWTTSDT